MTKLRPPKDKEPAGSRAEARPLRSAEGRRVQNKRPDAALKGGATFKKGAAVLRRYKEIPMGDHKGP